MGQSRVHFEHINYMVLYDVLNRRPRRWSVPPIFIFDLGLPLNSTFMLKMNLVLITFPRSYGSNIAQPTPYPNFLFLLFLILYILFNPIPVSWGTLVPQAHCWFLNLKKEFSKYVETLGALCIMFE